MDELTKTIASRGDLAHLALFLWASGASALLAWTLRELARANQRFEDFVKEIAALNVLRDPYSAKPYVLFYTTKRVGGGAQNYDAIKLLKFAAS